MENSILEEDYEYVRSVDYIPWEDLKNKTMLVTGGTGLIGSTLIRSLLYVNEKNQLNLHIVALVRNKQKAAQVFGNTTHNFLEYVVGTVEDFPKITRHIDYIVHAASPTASKFFIYNPVETIKAGVLGTINLLDLAVKENVSGFVYLSSMEAYGKITEEVDLTEDKLGYINPIDTRSCYPECKRLCEALCNAYAKEYGIRATSIRLAQTFGPGVARDDVRVFAMMARCALEKNDIILQTKGTSKHSYLYTVQAITAILTVLLKGEHGQVYNAANPKTYCSIYEMGEMVAQEITGGEIKVRVNENGNTSLYPDSSFLNLNIDKIKGLGWKPDGDLKIMYQKMIKQMIQT
jgi:UDP-glucuronate decarboxylase